jgi:hypothetical protein
MDKIKTWQERAKEAHNKGFAVIESGMMREEIADLRAALAASATTQQPSDLSKAILAISLPEPEYRQEQCIKPTAYTADQMRSLLSAAAALAAQPAAQEQTPIELVGVKDAIREGDGFWQSCSGCYDTEDGHPTANYSYSEIFGCPMGSGCSECGGLGVIWDSTDYEAMYEEEFGAQLAQSADTAEG